MEQTTLRTMLDDLLISLEQYLTRSLPHMKVIADQFYKQKDQQPWEELDQLSEALQWIFQAYESIDKAQTEAVFYTNWALIQDAFTKLSQQLIGLEKAMSSQDLTSVGDIIHYEIIPVLEVIRSEAAKTIDHEVVRHDIN